MYLVERVVTVLALKSFEGYRENELATAWMSERLANLIISGYLRLMWDPLWEVSHATDEGDNPPSHDVRPVT